MPQRTAHDYDEYYYLNRPNTDEFLNHIEQYFNERGLIVNHDRWRLLIDSIFTDWQWYLEDGS